jgi:exodeoxyribonuclease VII small subunit
MAEPNPPELNFEQALEQLQDVLRRLEDGKIGLEESLACYEQGVNLLRRCHSLLECAEKRIQVLMGVNAQGQLIVKPLETPLPESGSNAPAEPAVKRRRQQPPPEMEGNDSLFGP